MPSAWPLKLWQLQFCIQIAFGLLSYQPYHTSGMMGVTPSPHPIQPLGALSLATTSNCVCNSPLASSLFVICDPAICNSVICDSTRPGSPSHSLIPLSLRLLYMQRSPSHHLGSLAPLFFGTHALLTLSTFCHMAAQPPDDLPHNHWSQLPCTCQGNGVPSAPVIPMLFGKVQRQCNQ